MHPVRRRKKRPNYGVRTVEVKRGQNGFGFTISGQQPCILSCIVAGSPAEGAGLRAGDYLVAVEGQSVRKVPHDDVVRLIGASASGVLRLQIAENYYSDSSEDDVQAAARQKPKYPPHKSRLSAAGVGGRHAGAAGTSVSPHGRVTKVVRDLRSGPVYEERAASPPPLASRTVKKLHADVDDDGHHRHLHQDNWKAAAVSAMVGASGCHHGHTIPPPPQAGLRFRHLPPTSSEQSSSSTESGSGRLAHPANDDELFRAVVGYVGTIEMPRKLPPGSRVQIVRGCIKRLRAEKRTHTPVLMSVLTRSLRLTNGAGTTLAVYPGERVTFCGASADKDHRHFGVVTTASTGDDPSSSCHIFAVDGRPHASHLKRAQQFKLDCQPDASTGICREFPISCDPIITVIRTFYESSGMRHMDHEDEQDAPVIANSPQPSNDSSTTTMTSNSDSGIGFRDDCGHQSDRILVVDVVPNHHHRLHVREIDDDGDDNKVGQGIGGPAVAAAAAASGENSAAERLQAATSSRSRSPLSSAGSEGAPAAFLEDMSVSSEATKSPDVTLVAAPRPRSSFCAAMRLHSVDDMSITSPSTTLNNSSSCYKMSPKVFTSPPPPVSQSLEDLKESSQSLDDNGNRGQQPLWGSLQDLRTFSTSDKCFERCSASHAEMHEGEEKGVSAWAASFEKLLDDQTGLCTFAEFLKKEFSHENIYFWVACEKYKKLTDSADRKHKAREIFDRHLALGALEPVNVDSYARQVTEQQLDKATPTLFILAQKQIFNLMKFDSYPRFIKSDLYKDCVVRVLAGEELPVHDSHSELVINSTPPHSKLKKSRSDADERQRKSLLPWSRKTRAKSRDRVSLDRDDSSISSSRSSLTTWDVPLSSGLCRVILPDGSTAVVHTRPNQTVRYLISRLLDKRALAYNDFQVVHNYLNKPIALDEEAILLSGQEVKVERRVVFRLDLPNRKTIAVKSKQSKTLRQVLRPMLHKYGYRLEMVTLCLMSENEVLEPDLSVSMVDGQRIQVLTRCTPTECLSQGSNWRLDESVHKGKSLDEITNRVFEELLQGKAESRDGVATASDEGSVRSDDWGSESSSGILGRFLRRDSALFDKNRKNKKTAAKSDENERKSTLSKLPPLIAKLRPSAKFESRSESDVLYEGLKRAQRSRLEDQRGTEINFELPDFLKDKENTPQSGKKLRKVKLDDEESSTNKFFQDELRVNSPLESCSKTYSAGDLTRISTENLLANNSCTSPRMSPPPLPPKPRKLPPGVSWPRPAEPKPRPRTRKAIYLDQPSSSFV